jgi:trigger factor
VKVTTERLPESLVRLEIAAEVEESNQAIEKAYRKVSRDIAVPGFRKGKVPRQMLERLVGRETWVEEANRTLMDELYRKAIQEAELVPVGDPSDIEVLAPEPLAFKVTVPVYPTVDPGDYAAVRVEPVDAALAENAVEEAIEELRRNQSPWVDPAEPRKPKDGDQVTVDLVINEGEEEFQPASEGTIFVLGESQLLPDLKGLFESLNVGESGSVEISFPEEGEGAVDDLRKGKTLSYNVTLKELKERDLLPLDDEFAKTYAQSESLDELRKKIQDDLHAQKTREARTEAVNAIVNKIAEGATIEIPAAMIDDSVEDEINELRQRLSYSGMPLEAYLRQTNQTEAQLREEMRPNVARRLRNSLILREIAEREKIEIDADAVNAEIDAQVAGLPAQQEALETYRNSEYLQSMIRNQLFDRRLTDRIVEIATEGRGAIVNGFELPADEAATGLEHDVTDAVEPISQGADAGEALSVTTEAGTGWINGDGSADCPEGYPVKGNGDSMIYHTPESSSYTRTIPEICFATAEDAVAKGFRAPGSSD